jgi:hypothetical protein
MGNGEAKVRTEVLEAQKVVDMQKRFVIFHEMCEIISILIPKATSFPLKFNLG